MDKLIHHSEIVTIDADSFKLKEAKERNEQRVAARRGKKLTTK